MQKFAALWAAAKRLEGEAYRFRTRTGAYRAAQSSAKGSGHRQRFATACEDIFRDVSASAAGSKWRLGGGIAGRHGLFRLQLKAWGWPPDS